MKNKVLKASFTIAFCLYIIAILTYETGIRPWAIAINIITGLYIALFTYLNRNKWIFK